MGWSPILVYRCALSNSLSITFTFSLSLSLPLYHRYGCLTCAECTHCFFCCFSIFSLYLSATHTHTLSLSISLSPSALPLSVTLWPRPGFFSLPLSLILAGCQHGVRGHGLCCRRGGRSSRHPPRSPGTPCRRTSTRYLFKHHTTPHTPTLTGTERQMDVYIN